MKKNILLLVCSYFFQRPNQIFKTLPQYCEKKMNGTYMQKKNVENIDTEAKKNSIVYTKDLKG